MAGRIRNIRPELREMNAVATLTDGAHRLFANLFTLADDNGRCPAGASYLAGHVFFGRPRAPHVVGQYLAELEAAGLIRRYDVTAGPHLEIVGWSDKKHPSYQYIKKPHPQRYPAPSWDSDHPSDHPTDHTLESPEHDQRSAISDRDPDGERDSEQAEQAELAELAGAGSRSLRADGWEPPAGGKAQKAALARIAAGELDQVDVKACWAYCVRQGIHKSRNADARAAALIAKQKRRSNGACDLPADDAAYLEKPSWR